MSVGHSTTTKTRLECFSPGKKRKRLLDSFETWPEVAICLLLCVRAREKEEQKSFVGGKLKCWGNFGGR